MILEQHEQTSDTKLVYLQAACFTHIGLFYSPYYSLTCIQINPAFMTNKLTIGILTVIALACSNTKKNQATAKASTVADEPAINLDTIKVVADEEPKKKVYRAANPLTNDILHTKLEVSFDWQKSQLIGKAVLDVKPYFYPTNMLYLDARGMEIKSLKVLQLNTMPIVAPKGKKATQQGENWMLSSSDYKYERDSLKISLGREFRPDEKYKVEIEYISKPNELKKGGSQAINDDKGLYFINPKGEDPNKMPQIWTQGETQSNSAWFPTIDSPNEKMTNEIFMTVDNKYTTLSNGLLVASTKNADGTRTDHWKMDLPHAPYLVMMGVGEFVKVTDEPWRGKEVSYYVEKEYEAHAKGIFGNTKEMIEFYSIKLGVDYPWQKYAQIVARDYVSGAMENTSSTLHGDFMVYQTTREMIDGKKGEDVIAHELFHQWFGDLATSESWSNLPLNESFATYGEYLWNEYKYGRDAADEHHASSRSGYFMQGQQKQVHMIRYDYENREDMFDAFSYNKGGQILHMLRKIVGDDAFFASLKLYLENRRFKPAEIHHLRLAFEEVTGEDMNWFFNQWFMASGHPIINVTKEYNDANKTVVLKVEQKQDFKETPLYRLPLYVDLYINGKAERRKIVIDEAKQTFTLSVSAKPDLVNFDAERQLLAKITYEKSKEEYAYQFKNAPLWGDRDEALNYFRNNLSDKQIYELVKGAAQTEKWKNFRMDAISMLGRVAKENEAELKPLMVSVSEKDADTKVRAEAIQFLAANYTGKDLEALYEKAMNEQSYSILSAALQGLAKANPTLAMQKAKSLENEKGKKLIFTIADLYANNGTDENHSFFVNAQSQFSGFELLGYTSVYGKFLKRCTKPETVLAGAAELKKMAKSGNQYVRYGALKVIKSSLVDNWQSKEDKLSSAIEKDKKEGKDVSGLEAEKKAAGELKSKLVEIYNSVK